MKNFALWVLGLIALILGGATAADAASPNLSFDLAPPISMAAAPASEFNSASISPSPELGRSPEPESSPTVASIAAGETAPSSTDRLPLPEAAIDPPIGYPPDDSFADLPPPTYSVAQTPAAPTPSPEPPVASPPPAPPVEPAPPVAAVPSLPALELSFNPPPVGSPPVTIATASPTPPATPPATAPSTSSPPLPAQNLAASTQYSLEGLFQGNSDSLVARAVGSAEGTRTPDGERNPNYFGHTDPGNGVWNMGTFSFQHGADTPEEADQKQLQRLRGQAEQMEEKAVAKGMQLTLRESLNGIDLANQAPQAVLGQSGYVDWLAEAYASGKDSSDAILSARVNSFLDPATQTWNAPGLGNSEDSITHDQSRRMQMIDQAIAAYEQQPNQPLIAQQPAPSPVPPAPTPPSSIPTASPVPTASPAPSPAPAPQPSLAAPATAQSEPSSAPANLTANLTEDQGIDRLFAQKVPSPFESPTPQPSATSSSPSSSTNWTAPGLAESDRQARADAATESPAVAAIVNLDLPKVQ